MNRTKTVIIALLSILTAAGGTVLAQGVDLPRPLVSQDDIEAAIKLQIDSLYDSMNQWGHWEQAENIAALPEARLHQFWGGRTALVVLALLHGGESKSADRLQRAIKFLAEAEMTGTYAVGIRASVWSKMYDPRVRPLLQRDADWLMDAMTRARNTDELLGHYGYTRRSGGDGSNNQYGILGLRDAGIRGIEIPPRFWEAILKNMTEVQADNGGWAYNVRGTTAVPTTYGSMTVAGLANLYIAVDRLSGRYEGPFDGKAARGCGRVATPDSIQKALGWLDRNLPRDFLVEGSDEGDVQDRPTGVGLYYLYGLERCASASGRKNFGGLNWFQEGARWIISRQRSDGSHGVAHNTAWALLYLSKGQAPVFYNKLDTGADWNNDPLDIPNLSSWMADELEYRVNYQVVDIKDKVEEWLDAPVLYFNGHKFPEFTAEQKQKLRLYTDSGGTILAEACCSNAEFTRGMVNMAREVWPEWEFQALDRRHPVMTAHYDIKDRLPRIMHMNNGCRSIIFLAAEDLSCVWHQNLRDRYRIYFQFGMNLARYASDKRMIRSRLTYPPTVMEESIAEGKAPTPPFERLRIGLADWSTNTSGKRVTDIRAMRRLKQTLHEAANVRVDVKEIEGGKLDDLEGIDVLHISGHRPFLLTDDHVVALRDFVARGGLIWADAQCGRAAYAEPLENLRQRVFAGQAQPRRVLMTDPLITGKDLPRDGFDISDIRYKQSLRLTERTPMLHVVERDGKAAMIYSTYDLTCGLDGHDCADCRGPVRNDALRIATNILLSRVDPTVVVELDPETEGPLPSTPLDPFRSFETPTPRWLENPTEPPANTLPPPPPTVPEDLKPAELPNWLD